MVSPWFPDGVHHSAYLRWRPGGPANSASFAFVSSTWRWQMKPSPIIGAPRYHSLDTFVRRGLAIAALECPAMTGRSELRDDRSLALSIAVGVERQRLRH